MNFARRTSSGWATRVPNKLALKISLADFPTQELLELYQLSRPFKLISHLTVVANSEANPSDLALGTEVSQNLYLALFFIQSLVRLVIELVITSYSHLFSSSLVTFQ